ncbi:MAG: hypothetical protein ACLTER_06870 [Ruminococcus sp.]
MEKLGIDCEVKINPRSFVSEKKCDVKSKRFLMATRFVYAKGLDLMMESFEEFCKEDSEWELDIIGDGDLLTRSGRCEEASSGEACPFCRIYQ